mgnify:CR=1 FL=1
MPDMAGWDGPVHWACFNDDCPYYRQGWAWMWQHYQARVSYRFRVVNLTSKTTTPLAVWSDEALRDRIIEDPWNAGLL